MPRASAIIGLRAPGWGPAALDPGASPTRTRKRSPAPRGGAVEVAAGVALVIVWAALWAFFIAGVVEPGAALRASAAAHPSLEPAAAVSEARPAAGPGAVDRASLAP